MYMNCILVKLLLKKTYKHTKGKNSRGDNRRQKVTKKM